MISRILKRLSWTFQNLPIIKPRLEKGEVYEWLKSGKVGPAPHAVKQANLRQLQNRFAIKTLVETGTFRGDMLIAMSPFFEQLFSVELSEKLCGYSQERCSPLKNVTIHQGASEEILSELCGRLRGRVLFWLDGHFSGGDTALGDTECPVPRELESILRHPNIEPVIVIDDAREFVGQRSYPTVSEVLSQLCEGERQFHVTIHDDAIVAIPDSVLRA